ALRVTGLFVDLKELQKRCSAAPLTELRREEFSQIFGLLGGSTVVKGQKDGVKKGGINPINIPAAIKVIGDLLRRDETPVNVDRTAPSGSERIQRGLQSCKQPLPIACRAKAVHHFRPGRPMYPRR